MVRDYGAELESKFQKYLSEIACYSYKPVDFKSLMYLIANFKNVSNRVPKAPCDRMVVYNGSSTFFELKHTLGKSIPFSRFPDHQIGNLLKHEDAGGKSYVIIGFRDKKLEIFAMRVKPFISMRVCDERKSVRKEKFQEQGFLITNKDDLVSLLDEKL